MVNPAHMEMIILESILTTLERIVVFYTAGTLVKIVLSLKTNHHKQI